MKRLLACILVFSPCAAQAMNWEGHDDWMADFSPAEAFKEQTPHARPLPAKPCPVTEDMAKKNPYEQIPLPRHDCPARPENAEPER